MKEMLRAAISRLARRPVSAMGLLFLAGLVSTALPTLWYGPPLPAIHDEYGYLFLGETFAQGRLVNPPPPGPPEFYETFHEFITPRYEAKFPPGPGVALAAGILLGSPIIGVWLVNGLWAVALYWMLRGVAPPGWAFGGALAAVVGYGAMTYWGYSFWGGSVLALGGALAFGGALRLWRRRGNAVAAAALAGVGCAIMAVTRPLDGFIFALVPAGLVLITAWRDGWKRLVIFVLPALAGVALMLGYNQATTGSPLIFAHRLYDETYLPRVVLFVWEKPTPDPPGLPAFYTRYENAFASNMSADPLTAQEYWGNLKRFASAQFTALFPLWTWPLLAIGLLGIFAARDRLARLALLSLLFIGIPLLILRFYGFSHYTAAWTAPALLLIIQGARRLWSWRRRADISWLAYASLLLLALWPAAGLAREWSRGYPEWAGFPWVADREKLREVLADRAQQTGHKQLALVVYPPDHDPHAEWVFNSPDPAAQEVLWLRAFGPARVPELAKSFPGYDEWLVQVKANGQLDRCDPIKVPGVPPVAPLTLDP